jgi:microcin C transport system permease protein
VPLLRLNPITRKRLKRFREFRRAWYAFWLLVVLYGLSLFAEFLCHDIPLLVRHQGRTYFPVLRHLVGRIYPDDAFTGSGLQTRPDYKAIAASPAFASGSGNWMVWPPIRSGPREIVDATKVALPREVQVRFRPEPHVGTVDLRADGAIAKAFGSAWFFAREQDDELRDLAMSATWPLPAALREAMALRHANQEAPAFATTLRRADGALAVAELSPFRPRATAPVTVRLTLRQPDNPRQGATLLVNAQGEPERSPPALWLRLSEETRAEVLAAAVRRLEQHMDPLSVQVDGERYEVRFEREDFRLPFRPVQGHWLGLDSSGRDVFARLFYGLRIAMTFGLLLVLFSEGLGIVIGALMGYFGGWLDLAGQRFIEVWGSLPFLYIIILFGSIYGPSFSLLLVLYAVFHWIGISLYLRAEFLRLRKQEFVEAAKCLGLPTWRIVFVHILPNALVPVITFTPFSLVGAIGVLTALDYLGFGLPPGTPSWGELLSQAQEFTYAWWLVVYPFLLLVLIILLCVFVGEGVRAALDPRRFTRLE